MLPRSIHREGRMPILTSLTISALLLYFLHQIDISFWVRYIAIFAIVLFNLWLIYFFRIPERKIMLAEARVISPADGKIVAIEPVFEDEYFKDKRIMVSIFMSPMNAHVNWSPIEGFVRYFRYHDGKYLIAFHPKSSEKNERTSIVIENGTRAIMLRQIAGFIARRIKSYITENQYARMGEELGFIRFGSRVDIFLPKDAEINVKLGQKVKGGETIIAHFKE